MEELQAAWAELGVSCPCVEMNFEKQILAMRLMKTNPTPDEKKAFRDVAICIGEYAKIIKRALFKVAQEDNPKYAFRTWLLRLGMSGEEFKMTRKVLLARLSGSSAFRTYVDKKHQATSNGQVMAKKEGDSDVC